MELVRVATTMVDGEERFLIIVFNEGFPSLKRTLGPMTEAEFRDCSRDSGLDDAQTNESIQTARKNRLK